MGRRQPFKKSTQQQQHLLLLLQPLLFLTSALSVKATTVTTASVRATAASVALVVGLLLLDSLEELFVVESPGPCSGTQAYLRTFLIFSRLLFFVRLLASCRLLFDYWQFAGYYLITGSLPVIE